MKPDAMSGTVRLAAVLGALLLAGCGLSDEEAEALSEEVVRDMEAAEMQREIEQSQDFDRIAQETVDGMDTSGLGALTN
ncbi:hypothetical protein [Tropicimonas sp. S265A]|uniref:hypothetical protein n=1 Tax=Tropicimonas sp. S265A TaxID=3415134 RepID=UPI003C7CEBBC